MSTYETCEYISQVFHKTFVQVDEKGTEAAAATAVVMTCYLAEAAPPSTKVQVDRPFVFAIQEKSSGVCLFLGRVNDPR